MASSQDYEEDFPDDISDADSEATIEGVPVEHITNLTTSLELGATENFDHSNTDVVDSHGTPLHPWTQVSKWTIERQGDRINVDLDQVRRTSVELTCERNDRTGDFMRITQILTNIETGDVRFRGMIIRRQSLGHGMLDRKLNECYMVVDVFDNDDRASRAPHLHEICEDEIVRTRFLKLTNKPYGRGTFDESFRETTRYSSDGQNSDQVKKDIFESGILCCRWKLIQHYNALDSRGRPRAGESELRRISESEADREFAMKDFNLYRMYRGDLHRTGNTITLGDVFCGGGGILTGAQHAGLNVIFGVDHKKNVMTQYRLNAEGSICYPADCSEFLAVDEEFNIDILHFSPPCQPHSPAHTVPGKDDEPNEAALFVIGNYIDKYRPRLVTFEQSFGIVRTRERREWFALLVRELTSRNYSVRWNILNFRQYGLAQARKRLILVASCPGMPPPPLPAPTHGPGLHPYVSICEALRSVEGLTDDPDHQPKAMPRINRPPYDIDGPLRQCVTTKGQRKSNYYPTGQRNFTIRELAALQGFYPDYRLSQAISDTWKLRILGNAVPPIVAKQIFETCVKFLREQDARLEQAAIDAEPPVIDLD